MSPSSSPSSNLLLHLWVRNPRVIFCLQALGEAIATGQLVDIKFGVGSLKARDRKVRSEGADLRLLPLPCPPQSLQQQQQH